MDPFTILTLIMGAASIWIAYLTYRQGKDHTIDDRSGQPPATVPLLPRLLLLFWRYPIAGGNQASWAVKESLVLRGRIDEAREKPGIGVAIVTTELALNIFGDRARPFIDGVIAWGVSNCAQQFPFLWVSTFQRPRNNEIVVEQDFRHTLGFGIIIARTRTLELRLQEYLKIMFNTQLEDGGWSSGDGDNISEIFTVLYAIELLTLCGSNERLGQQTRACCLGSRKRALSWLISQSRSRCLWRSGVLPEFAWDDVVTTAWVLHRLGLIEDAHIPEWSRCVDQAASAMTSKAFQESTWIGSTDLQRFRVEARVAAAISRLLTADSLILDARELMQLYIFEWRRRSLEVAAGLAENEWDVATLTFVMESLFSTEQLRVEAEAVGL